MIQREILSNKGKESISKQRQLAAAVILIMILFPLAVRAYSRNSRPQKTKTENENQIVEQIQKHIERPEPLQEFPRGEQPVETIQTPKTTVYIQPKTIQYSDAKMFIYLHESGNNPYAVNPTSGACGLAQALPCSKMGCALGDYACQDAWATRYAISRYGGWEQARQFWLIHHWW